MSKPEKIILSDVVQKDEIRINRAALTFLSHFKTG